MRHWATQLPPNNPRKRALRPQLIDDGVLLCKVRLADQSNGYVEVLLHVHQVLRHRVHHFDLALQHGLVLVGLFGVGILGGQKQQKLGGGVCFGRERRQTQRGVRPGRRVVARIQDDDGSMWGAWTEVGAAPQQREGARQIQTQRLRQSRQHDAALLTTTLVVWG